MMHTSLPHAALVRRLDDVSGISPFSCRTKTHARLGEYELLEEIGHGGMGRVSLARSRKRTGRPQLWALKTLWPRLTADPSYVRLFRHEIRVARVMRHDNLVGVEDTGYADGTRYARMPYIEGCSLHELLDAAPTRRSPRLLLRILIDALTGLHAAHCATDLTGTPLNVVHCDFAPSNVLVGLDGKSRLCDFGVALSRYQPSRTRQGTFMGRPDYAAPEQIVSSSPADQRADIFAAGVMLWNALTGEQLFRSDSHIDTWKNILGKPVERPSKVGLRPPPCFDDVCLRALSRKPERRYQSALEMVEDLKRIRDAHHLQSASSELAGWVWKVCGRRLLARRSYLQSLR